jgi:hypothetical protein
VKSRCVIHDVSKERRALETSGMMQRHMPEEGNSQAM